MNHVRDQDGRVLDTPGFNLRRSVFWFKSLFNRKDDLFFLLQLFMIDVVVDGNVRNQLSFGSIELLARTNKDQFSAASRAFRRISRSSGNSMVVIRATLMRPAWMLTLSVFPLTNLLTKRYMDVCVVFYTILQVN